MNKEKLVSTMMKVLEEREYSPSESAISNIVDTTIERKADLINLFRKHPNWDEDQLCIHFDHDIERKVSPEAKGEFLSWLGNAVFMQIVNPAVNKKALELLNNGANYFDLAIDADKFNPLFTMVHEYTKEENRWGGGVTVLEMLQYLPDETLLPPTDTGDYFRSNYEKNFKYLNEMDESFNFRPGMKLNRVVNKICIKLGLDKLDGYNRAFAQFSDGVTPLKIHRHTTISVNPVDFLLMSNGNSWRSCHCIGDYPNDAGCYSSGTIAYMMGRDSFIVSVIDKDYPDGDLALAKKINRQTFGYRDHQLLQSRLYPQDCDKSAEEIYRNLREMVEQVITTCEDTPNRWVREKCKKVAHHGTAYPDWDCFSTLCFQYGQREFIPEETVPDTRGYIEMDNLPICIECGSVHDYEESIVGRCCEPHYCEDCGCLIDTSDPGNYIEYDGYYYCTDCRFMCTRCDQPERRRYEVYITDIDESWCDECAADYAFYCEDCNRYYSSYNTDGHTTEDGRTICEDCFREDYVLCEDCGYAIKTDEAVEIDGNYYCESCADKIRGEASA